MTDLLLPSTAAGFDADPRRPMMIAQDLHVNYRVYASGKKLSARESLTSLSSIRGGRDLQTIPALRGVSFTAREGESIGVVGHNGSGKSTLFRAMSGLIPPSEGAVFARDRPVLLGVNAALVSELSGENNIRLGLLAMGFSPDEAAARVGEIADFAELNDFIYHPMRTYSSGMAARLKFAIASAKAHSILLVDEALAVGDRRFRAKSEKRINELRSSAGLVMIVSHSAGSLRETCERVLWIHKGELIADGPAKDVIAEYMAWTKKPGAGAVGAASATEPRTKNAPVPGVQTAGATSTTEAKSTKNVVVGLPDASEGPRADARRERYRRETLKRKRRNLTLTLLTGSAILLAVAAGAIIGTLATFADSTAPADPTQPSTQPTAAAEAPTIATFTSNTALAECEAEEGVVELKLSWQIDDAINVALAAGGAQVDALDNPARAALPTQASDYAVAFACNMETAVYTLTAENEAGVRVSSPITVTRVLPEPEPEPEPEPQQPWQPAEPSQPEVPTEPEPGTDADAGADAGAGADADAGADAGTDTGADADAGTDAGTDTGADAGTDAGADAGTGVDGATDAGAVTP